MYSGHTVGVVVPAYNEEGFVGEVIETTPEYVDRVYVVDDDSTDGTWNEIRRHAKRVNEGAHVTDSSESGLPTATDGGAAFEQRVVPIRHETNRGVGGAIKTGYLAALDDEIDVTAVLAGDGQMDPELLPRLLDPIVDGDAEYAKGNRLLYREYREGMSRWRFFGNSILTFLTKVASGYWTMMDPQNGYTAISRRALEDIAVEDVYEYYGYCNDLLVKLNASEMPIADVAMPAIYGDEKSSIRYSTYIPKVSRMLFHNFLWRLKMRYVVADFHPLVLFYAIGALSTAVGVLAGLWSQLSPDSSQRSTDSSLRSSGASDRSDDAGRSKLVRSLVSFSLVVTGSLSLGFGMLFDKEENEELEVQIDDS